MNNYFSYTSQGTGFNTGLAAGNFTIPGNVNRGISINQPMFYRFSPLNAGVIITDTQTISATPGTEIYKLSNYVQGVGRATLVPYSLTNYVLLLDVPRTIYFALEIVEGADIDAKLKVTYIDQYGQIGVKESQQLDNDNKIYNFPVGVLGIVAVDVIKGEANTASFNIVTETTDKIELMYNDLEQTALFTWISGNDVNEDKPRPQFRTLTQATPFLFIANLKDGAAGYIPASQDEQTLTTGQPRPLINLENYDFDANQTITIVQNVFGIGLSSENLPAIDPVVPIITYNPEKIFGRKNYTVGWKPYQG